MNRANVTGHGTDTRVAARTIAVVGASLAGLRAAEELRRQGFDGRLVLIGDEVHLPYDRPPLSKKVLAGVQQHESIVLPLAGDLDAEWELGRRAEGFDAATCTVTLDDGRTIVADGVVIATGASPRRLPGWPDAEGVHVLRSIDDCLALRADLDQEPARVVVIGAGFIGAEVAATARTAGLDVTVLEALPMPLVRGLGEEMGAVCADIHRDHGVDLRLSTGVAGIDVDGAGRVARVQLADGSAVDADVVVVGVGVAPNTAWLEGSGLVLADGVVCDETCLAAPGVVAAGDIARWPNQRFDEVMRVEHWDNAQEQGDHAARTLLADLAGGRGAPFAPVPWFWSDQYDRKLQVAGRSSSDAEVRVVEGDVAERRFVALYGKSGRLVAALGMNRPRHVMQWRARIEAGMRWDAALELAAAEPGA